MKVLVIIPAYNEEASILKTVQSIKEVQDTFSFQLDYLVINDGSTDGTRELLLEHHIPCVNLVKNLGIGGAVQTGYIYAQYNDYDVAVQFDGDGQHDIVSLNKIVLPIIEGKADFTVGSRFVSDSPSHFKTSLSRRVGISILSKTIQLRTGKKILDITSGYRGANREVIQRFANHYPKKYPEPETNAWLVHHGMKIEEVGVNMFEREQGTSSITPFKSIRYMVEVILSILLLSNREMR